MGWVLSKHVAWQQVGQQTIIVDLQGAKSFGLNASGSLIWSLLPDHEFSDIVAALQREFVIREETATEDARSFITTLEERQLAFPVGP